MYFGIVDVPNHRSSHTEITPRGGGIVFALLWLLMVLAVYDIGHLLSLKQCVLLLLPLLIAGIGFIDDCHPLSIKWRFAVHVITAVLFIWLMQGFSHLNIGIMKLDHPWIINILLVATMAWSTNAYNFMDGLDGLAASEGIFIFSIGGLFLLHGGAWLLAALSFYMAVILMGFLYWNWPPAKLFMGDAGSTFLGCLIIVFALLGQRDYAVPAWWWLELYGIFLFDASITLLRRMLKVKQWYQAHRSHAVQRLYKMGWSERKIIYTVLMMNLVLAALVCVAVFYPSWRHMVVLLIVIKLSIIYRYVERIAPMLT